MWPGSSTDWVLASDNPLLYIRLNPTNTGAATSQYIDEGDFRINHTLETFYISPAGSMYFVTISDADPNTSYVLRIGAAGNTLAQRMKIYYDVNTAFLPVGIELNGSDLIVSVLRESSPGNRALGAITLDSTTLSHTARFSTVDRDITSTYLSLLSGDVYIADVKDTTNSRMGFA